MYKRVGMQLEKSERDKLKEIKKRLSELSIDFQENIIKDDGVIWFSKNELEGLPDDFFEGRTQKEDKEDGQVKYEVTTKYPDLFPVLRMAKNGETRRRLQVFEAQRCKENVKILEEAVELRFEAAKILGYKSHADFVLENKMAKTVANVEKFEKELRELLEPIAAKELEDMLELKRKDEGAKGANVDDCIYVWDFRYYLRLLKEKLYNVDEEKIKEYFAMENVVSGILSIYQEMLGLKFIQVDNSSGWHKDAQLFEVYNSEDKSFVGHFWMDMHPREGKYTHAACWSLRPGFERADGSRQYPVSAIVANLSKPTPTRPSLLKHDELVTFFHEFGHLMHNICSQTKWSRFHGVEVERDFVEAPSQMLENWCWEPEVLQTFAKHYETNEPIPAEVVTKLVNAKNLGAGLLNLRQIFFGLFDLQLHSLTSSPKVNPIDIVKLYNDLRLQISNVHSGEEETWQVATFGHIMGGYDSGYYGYLWSEVFSADMFYSRFKVEGLKNKKTGYDYKNLVLGPGGSKDGMDILIDFLGREPNNVSFLKSIGIY
ncbi:Thimet oligopeptidase [Zancudomyces culisetae]|uniref:Thimet oligopeptidase n=1 Tax=Zancudomyces culisetae TaxID=1213189 RepID=A0A1R1PLR0_ZANCU|nr:Thimet oligopeptidase [Zancudomyces culisetae]|eukprot:OMH81869.1 Thimet oligopeptidase [Zancudomyces culisetae]